MNWFPDMRKIEHKLKTEDKHQLHLVEVCPDQNLPMKEPLLFVHGAIESGRVFYTESGKGLAPFLVEQGHPCYILDLRGKGESRPSLQEDCSHNQQDILDFDFPAAFDFVANRHPVEKFHIITHSWGGVLINAFLLRSEDNRKSVASCVHLAVKRRVRVFNIHRLFYIDLMWLLIGNLIASIKGFLPPRFYGPDGESKGFLRESVRWIYLNPWTDSKYDYHSQTKSNKLPSALYLTGSKDQCMGHYRDVVDFAIESGHTVDDVQLLSRKNGYMEDYTHLSILISKRAPQDHFQKIHSFLEKNKVSGAL